VLGFIFNLDLLRGYELIIAVNMTFTKVVAQFYVLLVESCYVISPADGLRWKQIFFLDWNNSKLSHADDFPCKQLLCFVFEHCCCSYYGQVYVKVSTWNSFTS
jgi:hypothetical protein